MPGRLEVVAFGTTYWTKRLDRMAVAATHARAFFLEELIPDIERIQFQVFQSQGRRGGGSWKFLSDETIKTKLRKNQDPRINIATGTLMRSLSEPEADYAVREVTNYRLRFGSTAPGAKQSQEHRPFMHFTKFDRRRWAMWWGRFIVRAGNA